MKFSMQTGSTYNNQVGGSVAGKGEQLTSITRIGQITLPIGIRRSLGLTEGDKIVVSLIHLEDDKQPQAMLRPVRSVAEMTYGAVVVPIHGHEPRLPSDLKAMRRAFEEGVADQVMAAMPIGSTTTPLPHKRIR